MMGPNSRNEVRRSNDLQLAKRRNVVGRGGVQVCCLDGTVSQLGRAHGLIQANLPCRLDRKVVKRGRPKAMFDSCLELPDRLFNVFTCDARRYTRCVAA